MRRLGCSVLVAVAATTNPSLQERLNTSLSSIYLIKGKRLRRVWGGGPGPHVERYCATFSVAVGQLN